MTEEQRETLITGFGGLLKQNASYPIPPKLDFCPTKDSCTSFTPSTTISSNICITISNISIMTGNINISIILSDISNISIAMMIALAEITRRASDL